MEYCQSKLYSEQSASCPMELVIENAFETFLLVVALLLVIECWWWGECGYGDGVGGDGGDDVDDDREGGGDGVAMPVVIVVRILIHNDNYLN